MTSRRIDRFKCHLEGHPDVEIVSDKKIRQMNDDRRIDRFKCHCGCTYKIYGGGLVQLDEECKDSTVVEEYRKSLGLAN